MVQLFNWFPRKWRGFAIAIAQTASASGYISSFLFDDWWSYFPMVPFGKATFRNEFALRHFIIGTLVLAIAVIDYFTFYNYPMQRSIILAKTERSKAENQKLVEIAMKTSCKAKLFSEFFKGENRSKMGFSVSFTRVLSIRETQLILLGGCLKNIADFYEYSLCGITAEELKKNDHNFAPFFIGQVAGMVLAGLSNDLFFKKCQTLVVTIINVLAISWNIFNIIFANTSQDFIALQLTLYGILNGFSDMYIVILLPMTIADKNRVLAYELTMLGTIFALVHFCFYVSTSLIAGFTIEVIR